MSVRVVYRGRSAPLAQAHIGGGADDVSVRVKSVFSVSLWLVALAMPKSMTWGRPAVMVVTMTLEGLDIPMNDALVWACCTALQTCKMSQSIPGAQIVLGRSIQ